MFCPNCRTVNENTFRYCYRCGFTLPVFTDEEDTVPEAVPEVSAAIAVDEFVQTEESVTVESPVTEPEPVLEEVPCSDEDPVPEPVAAPPKSDKKGRLLPPLLVLILLITIGLWAFFAVPQPEGEPQPAENPTPWFTVNKGVLTFDESLYDGDSELVVPATIGDQTVTVIGKDCFKGCRSLTTVILPDTVTEIRQQAFSNCSGLRGIFIPEGVKTIVANAFSNCKVLEAIHLPSSLKTLDQRAFSRCRNLVHIFYIGTYEDWVDLYAGALPTDAWIYCEDGKFPYAQG